MPTDAQRCALLCRQTMPLDTFCASDFGLPFSWLSFVTNQDGLSSSSSTARLCNQVATDNLQKRNEIQPWMQLKNSPRPVIWFMASLAQGATFKFKQCGLTIRSTGPIAAFRHLGYKSLAQMPAHRNGPVSSNVKPHPMPQGQFSRDSENALSGEKQFRFERAVSLSNSLLCGTCACSSRGVSWFLFSSAGCGLTWRSTGHFAAVQVWALKA